jgi:hypothetical protein
MESDRYNVSDRRLVKRVGRSRFTVSSESERVSKTPNAKPTNRISEREIASEVPPVRVTDKASEIEIVSETPNTELADKASKI